MNNSLLVFVVYDGIQQAIFEGQILIPLIKRTEQYSYEKIIIISFEHHPDNNIQKYTQAYEKLYPQVTFMLYKRLRFVNTFFLWHSAYQLRHFLKKLPQYDLIARGPFAGFIAKRALTKRCGLLTIQSRGLVGEEHAYAHKDDKGLRLLAHTARLQQLHSLEKQAYTRPRNKKLLFTVEVVSPALQDYIASTYQTPASCFTMAPFDSPEPLTQEQTTTFRLAIRAQLSIPANAVVYAYNGSLKPWQCAKETVEFFKAKWTQNPGIFFLVITQETTEFQKLLNQANLPATCYRIFSAPHQDIIPTLCAADYGLLLREPHLMNWVSRPTKLLEYQAAGLKVIHNNTIKLLQTIPSADD